MKQSHKIFFVILMIASVNWLDAMRVVHENNLHENKPTILVVEPKTPAANSSWGNWLYEQVSHLQKKVYDTNKPLGGWVRDPNESSAESYQDAVMGNHSYIEPTRTHTPSIAMKNTTNQSPAPEIVSQNNLTTNPQQPVHEGFDIKIETPLLDAAQSAIDAVSNTAQSAYNASVQLIDNHIAQPVKATVNSTTTAAKEVAQSAAGAVSNVALSTAKTVANYTVIPAAKATFNYVTGVDPNQHPAAVAGQLLSNYIEKTPIQDPSFIGPRQQSSSELFLQNITPQARQNANAQFNTTAQQLLQKVGTASKNSTQPEPLDIQPQPESFLTTVTKPNQETIDKFHETSGSVLNAVVGVAADTWTTAANKIGQEQIPSNIPQAASPYTLNDANQVKINAAKNATIDAGVRTTNKAVIDHFNPTEQPLPDNVKTMKGKNGTTIEEVQATQKEQALKENATLLTTAAKNQKLSTIVDVPTGDLFKNNTRLDIRDGVLKAVYLGKKLNAIAVTLDKTTGLYTAKTTYSNANIDLDPLRVQNKLNESLIKQALNFSGISGMSKDIAQEIINAAKPIEDNTLEISFDPTTNIVTQKLTKKSMSNKKGETGATIETTTSFNASLKPKQAAAISQQLIGLFRGTKRYAFNGAKNVISTISNYMAKKFKFSAQETAAAEKEITPTAEQMSQDLAQIHNDGQFNARFKSWMDTISEQYVKFVDRINAIKNPSSGLQTSKTMVIKGAPGDRFTPDITISTNAQTNELQFATFEQNGKTYKLKPGAPDENGIITLSAHIEYKDATAMQQLTANLGTLAREKLVMDPALNGIMASDFSHAYPALKNSIMDWYYG